jgi:toxin-antitoxin system PIN domain toxin
VIALDTNILVYAHRRDSQWFGAASTRVRELAESGSIWGIPWPCVQEFLAIVTHPRIYKPPTPLNVALRQVENWMESPSLRVLGELEGHWAVLSKTALAAKIHGGAMHDARIAAICKEHGVDTLWTVDRDFTRFAGLRTKNPLLT